MIRCSTNVLAVALLVIASLLPAVEPAPLPAVSPVVSPVVSPTVATINGLPLTLREVENSMLRREGGELVEEWVHHQLEGLDFATLQDQDVILSIGFNKITRREIADSLLRKGVGKVRDELINIRLVEQAIAAAGIVVGPAEIDATYARMSKRFTDDLTKKGDTQIDFANFLQVKEKMTPEQFRAQPGFRMIAGLQALVHQQAKNEWNDDELRAWFTTNKARWRQIEAVDLAVIAIPYRQEPGPTGQPITTPAERERLILVMDSLYRQITAKQLSFAQIWALYAKTWDPEARDGGRIGWVEITGRRDGAGTKTRIIGAEVMKAAWPIVQFPTLLPPLAGDWGVEIAEVRGHRPAQEPVYEDLRSLVHADRVDETLDVRTSTVLRDLRQKAKIDYASLPEIINGPR